MFPTEKPERSLKISLHTAEEEEDDEKDDEEEDEEEEDDDDEEEDDDDDERHLLYPLRCAAADGLSASDEDHLVLFWRSRLL